MSKINIRSKLKAFFFFISSTIACSWPLYAKADCYAINGWQNKVFNIAFPKMVVSPDTPNGTVLFSKTVNFPDNEGWATGCVPGAAPYTGNFSVWLPNTEGLAYTNVAGVGIKITNLSTGVHYKTPINREPIANYFLSYEFERLTHLADGFTIQLIKTGPISTGSLTTGTVASTRLKNLYYVLLINITDGGSFSAPDLYCYHTFNYCCYGKY